MERATTQHRNYRHCWEFVCALSNGKTAPRGESSDAPQNAVRQPVASAAAVRGSAVAFARQRHQALPIENDNGPCVIVDETLLFEREGHQRKN
jgi:hypothetical protein